MSISLLDTPIMAERETVKKRTQSANRGALVRHASGKIPYEDMYLKIQAQDYKCMYCKWPISFNTCEVEHIHPICKGGEHYLYNIALTCSTCNGAKGRRTLKRFCEKMGFDWHAILQEIADINHKLHIQVFGADIEDLDIAA